MLMLFGGKGNVVWSHHCSVNIKIADKKKVCEIGVY